MTTPHRTPFTLIELLVVIAVVLLLAAMLLPVLGRAKSSSRSVKCTSNMKQVLNGFALYTDANKLWPDANYGAWSGLIATDMSTVINDPDADTVFKCPSNSTHNSDVFPGTVGYGLGGTTFYNDLVVNNYVTGGAFGYEGVPIQQLVFPAETILVMDGTVRQKIYSVVFQDYCQFYTDGTSGLQRLDAPHEDALNMGFVDGHVERTPREKVVESTEQPITSPAFLEYWDPLHVQP